MKKRRVKNQNRIGTLSITIVVLMLFGVISMKGLELQAKNKEYITQEKELEQQLQKENDRAKEISEYEQYTKTKEFIEDIAKRKLGLAYPDEIIFKSDKK